MIDRITARLGRKLYEVPVGFKWFVDGLLDGSLGFAGEESAGASFVRRDGSAWTTDKDGFIPCLLAAEITARTGRDPGEIYRELTREFGEPVYDRVEAPATPEQKEMLANFPPAQVQSTDLAGEKIQSIQTHAPGNGAPIGGLKVVTENGWFAARPSGTESIYKIYAESFRGEDHLCRILEEAQSIVKDALTETPDSPRTARIFSPAIYSCNQPPVNPARRKPIWIGGTLPHQTPEKSRAVILYHHHDRSLVEPIVALAKSNLLTVIFPAREGRVIAALEAVLARHLRVGFVEMFNGRQHQFRRERERGDHRPRRQRAIVGSVRNAARYVVVEFLASMPLILRRAGPGPSLAVIPQAYFRTPQTLSDSGSRTPAARKQRGGCSRNSRVRLRAHVVVLDAAKVDPDVRELMNEERTGVEKLLLVKSFPFISRVHAT